MDRLRLWTISGLGAEGAARLAAALTFALLLILLGASSGALGCSRHIDVIDRGPAPAPDACRVTVDVGSSCPRERYPGTVIRLYREEDDDARGRRHLTLITSATSQADRPTEIVDLEPGRYRVELWGAPHAGSRVIARRFALAPGRSLLLDYDDNQANREMWADLGYGVAKGVAITLFITSAVALDVSLCCCSGGCYHEPVFTLAAVQIAFH